MIRELSSIEEIPYELLLLADPSKDMLDTYIHDSTLIIYELDGYIIGVCVLSPIDASTAEIKNLAIREDYQNKGYGKLLIRNVIDRARKMGYRILTVSTADVGTMQLYFYQREGFEMVALNRNFFLENYDQPLIEENGMQCRHQIVLHKYL